MSPINVTNLLMKLAVYNKNVNAANRNIQNYNQNQVQNQFPNQVQNQNLQQPTNTSLYSPIYTNNQNVQNQQILPQNNQLSNLNNIVQQNNILAQNNNINNSGSIVESFLANKNPVNTAHTLTNLQKTYNPQDLSSRIANLNIRNQNINNVKEMMNLPKEMNEVLNLIQNQSNNATAQTKANQQANGLILNNIDIKTLTQLIQKGSKDALNQMMDISIAQRLSGEEIKQIKDAISSLNAGSVSQESQTQALKNFMLLYLPWLPLEEGMDFELDFSFSEGSEEDDENILNIVIMTRHFGEIHILIILKSISSFEIYIQCCSNFPKNVLLKLVGQDEKKHTLKASYVFEEQKNFEPKGTSKEAKIMLSNVKEISPFLLLIANSLIKNTFLLDVQAGE